MFVRVWFMSVWFGLVWFAGSFDPLTPFFTLLVILNIHLLSTYLSNYPFITFRYKSIVYVLMLVSFVLSFGITKHLNFYFKNCVYWLQVFKDCVAYLHNNTRCLAKSIRRHLTILGVKGTQWHTVGPNNILSYNYACILLDLVFYLISPFFSSFVVS